jgi:hypothetical protein
MKIKCKSIPDRFSQGGDGFSNSPAEYEVNEKTLKALQGEPMLVVEILPEEKKDPEKGKAPTRRRQHRARTNPEEGQREVAQDKEARRRAKALLPYRPWHTARLTISRRPWKRRRSSSSPMTSF